MFFQTLSVYGLKSTWFKAFHPFHPMSEQGLNLRSCTTLNLGVAMVNEQNLGVDMMALDDQIRVARLHSNL